LRREAVARPQLPAGLSERLVRTFSAAVPKIGDERSPCSGARVGVSEIRSGVGCNRRGCVVDDRYIEWDGADRSMVARPVLHLPWNPTTILRRFDTVTLVLLMKPWALLVSCVYWKLEGAWRDLPDPNGSLEISVVA